MNVKKVIRELKKKYPGMKVVVNEDGEYREVICELKPVTKGPKHGRAVAVVGKIKPHYHKKTTETYVVLEGILKLYLEGRPMRLDKGEGATIPVGVTHWAEGEETWFEVYSTPPWTSEDHIFVE